MNDNDKMTMFQCEQSYSTFRVHARNGVARTENQRVMCRVHQQFGRFSLYLRCATMRSGMGSLAIGHLRLSYKIITMESFSPLIAVLADAIIALASTVGCDVLQP